MILIEIYLGANDTNGFAPSFIEKPRIIPNESGTLITMKCRCKAKPEPTVTWYRGQEVVNKSNKIKIKCTMIAEDTYELTLEIKVKPNLNLRNKFVTFVDFYKMCCIL